MSTMTTRQTALLEAFNETVHRIPRLMVRPQDMGTGLLWRLKRLMRYRGVYARHLLQQAQMRLGLLGDGDMPATTFWGREMLLPVKDSNANIIRQYGTLYPEEDGLTRFLIRTLTEDAVFYDIGANYGYYTALAEELIPQGEIHAFEPNEIVFPYLETLAGHAKNVTLNKVALADTIGTLSFYDCSTDNASGQSTLVEEVANREHPGQHTSVQVAATTLDEYCRTHAVPTVIKLDVEGGESAVLKGAQELLREGSPIIAAELWSGEGSGFSKNVLKAFEELRYEPFFIRTDGSLELTTRAYLDTWLETRQADMNFVFKKPGK